jgi:MoaA/NifB/PqqE/SkfB family radical SAM enzyme
MEIRNALSYLGQNKIFAHIDRISEWAQTGTTWPITIELDPTNNCNHRCPRCAGGRKNKEELDFEFMKRVIDEISRFCRGLIFTGGGEPLYNPHTGEMIKYARQKGIDVGLITNGGLLTKELIKIVIDNCLWVRVSIDAAIEKDYRISHGMDEKEFSLVWRNVSLLSEERDKRNSNCTVGVAYLTNEYFQKRMFMFAQKAKESGVNYAQFRPFHFNKTNVLEEVKRCNEINDEKFKVIASVHKYEQMNKEDWRRDYKICFGHHFATVIAADKNMYLCCHMRGKEKYCLGNLEKQNFEKLWASERRREVYNHIHFKDCPPMCRCDTFNEILWQIFMLKTKGVHLNFL